MARPVPIVSRRLVLVLVLLPLVACGLWSSQERGRRGAPGRASEVPRVADGVLLGDLRDALAEADGLAGTALTPYVSMGPVFLGGFVATSAPHHAAAGAPPDAEGGRSGHRHPPLP